MNRLTILDDDLEFSRRLLNYIISKNKKILLSSLVITGEEILETLDCLTKNDILLVDLNIPKINGLQIIDTLRKKNKNLPHIIVINGDENVLEHIKHYLPYIHTVMEKPFSFHKMLEIIEEIIFETEKKSYEKIIKEELLKFEANPTTKGYGYIVEAIELTLHDEILLKDMKNGLYKVMALKHKEATPINIKWSLEKCVKSITRFTSTKVLREYFHIEVRENLAPKLFIATITENIKTQIGEKQEEVYYY